MRREVWRGPSKRVQLRLLNYYFEEAVVPANNSSLVRRKAVWICNTHPGADRERTTSDYRHSSQGVILRPISARDYRVIVPSNVPDAVNPARSIFTWIEILPLAFV
jgi:hypothetical protein